MSDVWINMPANLTPAMLHAVRIDETTRSDDQDEMHRRIGWLLCAWDVLKDERMHMVVPEEKGR